MTDTTIGAYSSSSSSSGAASTPPEADNPYDLGALDDIQKLKNLILIYTQLTSQIAISPYSGLEDQVDYLKILVEENRETIIDLLQIAEVTLYEPYPDLEKEEYLKLVNTLKELGVEDKENFYDKILYNDLNKRIKAKGIENLGSLCYMNAFLQCLTTVPGLRGRLCEASQWSEDSEMALENDQAPLIVGMCDETAKHLSEVVNAFFVANDVDDSEAKKMACENLVRQLYIHNVVQFQQDISNLAGSDSDDVKKKMIGTQQDIDEVFQRILGSIKDFGTQIVSFVKPLQEGGEVVREGPLLTSKIACHMVDEKGERYNNTLEALVRNYFMPERMDAEDRHIGCRVVSAPPEEMVISLNRFRFDRATGGAVKVQDPVEFPENGILDLRDIFDPEAVCGVSTCYEISAVACHHGDSIGSGHYTAFVKKPDGWYHCDDSKVSPAQATDEKIRNNGYVYVLKRL